MSSITTISSSCIFCNKECKNSDSRPYPNSKSKHRIHNKCQIKKALADKKQPNPEKGASLDDTPINPAEVEASTVSSLMDRASQEQNDMTRAINERKMNKLLEANASKQMKKDGGSSSSQFFFDLKAGIAKPHEKRRYLHHGNLCEIATRYDDNGFKNEAIGRAYDHTGKDLNSLGDSDEEDGEEKVESECYNNSYMDPKNVGKADFRKRKRDYDARGDEKRVSSAKVDERNPCWFCLSSPKVEKHLIVAIGDYCYLTLAKGGLNDEHLLILPIEHIESLNSAANSKELKEELERIKQSLVDYFKSESKGVVFFERNFKSVHWQLQVVPISYAILDTVEKDIKSVSRKHFNNSNYLDIPDNCSLRDMIHPNMPYFYWQLEPHGSRFVTQIQVKGSFFPVQFGRLVLTDPSILNCSDKVDWKTCAKTTEDYIDLVRKTKEKYRDFDIT